MADHDSRTAYERLGYFCSSMKPYLPFDTVISIGDSYSAVCGTDGLTKPGGEYCASWISYPNGTLSSHITSQLAPRQGINWLQYLTGCTQGSPYLCITRLFNLAHAGATTGYFLGKWFRENDASFSEDIPFMQAQYEQLVDQILPSTTFTPSTLVTLFLGINDVFYRDVFNHDPRPELPEEFAVIMTRYTKVITDLAELGFRHFLILNVPDLTSSMAYSLINNTMPFVSSSQWNTALDTALAGMSIPGANIRLFDVHGLFQDILRDPTSHGIINTKDTCIEQKDDECMHTFFWYDSLHVTDRVHQLMAEGITERYRSDIPLREYMLPQLSSIYIIACTVVALLALFGLKRRLMARTDSAPH